jgi:hypothetical protein
MTDFADHLQVALGPNLSARPRVDSWAESSHQSRLAANRCMATNEVLANLDALVLSTMTYLDEMSRAPRRPAPP